MTTPAPTAFHKDIEWILRFQALVAEISASLVDIPSDEVDRAIDTSFAHILDFLDLDRCTLWVRSETEGVEFRLANVVGRPGIPPITSSFTSDDLPWASRQMLAGKEMRFVRIDDLPDEAAKDKVTLREFGPEWSVLAIPLKSGARVIGAIAIGKAAQEVWPEELVSQMRVIAQVFSNALVRRSVEGQLKSTLREVEGLKEQLALENVYLRKELEEHHPHGRVIGRSPAIRRVLAQAEQVARTSSTVLLLGETGTGKELIASIIHETSQRRERAMVRVNCAGIPSTLVENELFGREKGAYTGALTRQIGRFELADHSTIFLDEIAELVPEVQVKLLRVLQEREIERLGNPRPIAVDVRVIAATNQDLEKAVRDGRFRQDLFYRLNVFPIRIPPLRERREDIPLLTWAFVEEFSKEVGKTIASIPRGDLEALMAYPWPGNIRELRNTIERAMILCNGPKLHIEINPCQTATDPVVLSLREMEIQHIRKILEMTGWRVRGKQGAAEILEMKPTTLETRMAKLGIARPRK
ncbi:MAG: sigma 54-interacting transcriptional regulator [Acidobacteriota bacterium]